MKFLVSVLLTLMLAVCGLPSQGDTALLTFEAYLDGPSEAPPNDSPGTGYARVSYDSTAQTLRVEATFQDLLSPTTAAHIHAATAQPFTGAVGVAAQPPSFTGFPLGVTSGAMDETYDLTQASFWNPAFVINFGGGTLAGAEAALVAALLEGRAYFNIHTSQYPAGEIRGFLVPTPMPATALLLGTGLAALAGIRFRRKKR